MFWLPLDVKLDDSSWPAHPLALLEHLLGPPKPHPHRVPGYLYKAVINRRHLDSIFKGGRFDSRLKFCAGKALHDSTLQGNG